MSNPSTPLPPNAPTRTAKWSPSRLPLWATFTIPKSACSSRSTSTRIGNLVHPQGFFKMREGNEKVEGGEEVSGDLYAPGDLVGLPVGIFHWSTTDEGNFIKAMRLFKEEVSCMNLPFGGGI